MEYTEKGQGRSARGRRQKALLADKAFMAFSRERSGGDREESDHMSMIEAQAETSMISLRKWEVLKVFRGAKI